MCYCDLVWSQKQHVGGSPALKQDTGLVMALRGPQNDILKVFCFFFYVIMTKILQKLYIYKMKSTLIVKSMLD